MIYYDRIEVFGRNDFNKRKCIKEFDVCHSWYFLNYIFKFQPNVCDRCHDLLMMSVNLSDIVISNIKGSNYRFIISLISKNEIINLLQNADLNEKIRALSIKKI